MIEFTHVQQCCNSTVCQCLLINCTNIRYIGGREVGPKLSIAFSSSSKRVRIYGSIGVTPLEVCNLGGPLGKGVHCINIL